VVGVVGDVRHDSLDGEVYAEIYQPVAQKPAAVMTVVARSPRPEGLAAPFRAQMTGLPERALLGTTITFTAMRERTTLDRRNHTVLLGVLGMLGTVLAAVGVFGLTAFSVGQRTKEIGIRMALGADGMRVLRTVVGSQLLPIGLGVAFGIAGSWWATRTLSAYLFGVKPTDPATFASVAVIIALVGLAACLIPARRALRVDPVNALRAE
jgi:putative ABC transport system permease protein